MSRKRILFERSFSLVQCKHMSWLREEDARIFCTLDLLARKHLLLHGYLWDTKCQWGGNQGGWEPSNSFWGMATCLLNTQVPKLLSSTRFPFQLNAPGTLDYKTILGNQCWILSVWHHFWYDLFWSGPVIFLVFAEQDYHRNEDSNHGKHILIRKAMPFSLLPIVFVTLH